MYEIDVRSAVCDEEDGWMHDELMDFPISDIRYRHGKMRLQVPTRCLPRACDDGEVHEIVVQEIVGQPTDGFCVTGSISDSIIFQ